MDFSQIFKTVCAVLAVMGGYSLFAAVIILPTHYLGQTAATRATSEAQATFRSGMAFNGLLIALGICAGGYFYLSGQL